MSDYNLNYASRDRQELTFSLKEAKLTRHQKKMTPTQRFKIHTTGCLFDDAVKLPGFFARLFGKGRLSKEKAHGYRAVWIQCPTEQVSGEPMPYKDVFCASVEISELAEKLGVQKGEVYKHLIEVTSTSSDVPTAYGLPLKTRVIVAPRFISKSLKTAYTSAATLQARIDKLKTHIEKGQINLVRKDLKTLKKDKKIGKDLINRDIAARLAEIEALTADGLDTEWFLKYKAGETLDQFIEKEFGWEKS